MSPCLRLGNRQRTRRVNLPGLRRIAVFLLTRRLPATPVDLGICLVSAAEINRLNETFLRHRGTTDVITFNYAPPGQAARLHGDIFICVEEAVLQARRLRTSWQSELVRYVVHGVLHLCGYDDGQPKARQKMKREEDRLVRELAARFALGQLDAARLKPRGEQ